MPPWKSDEHLYREAPIEAAICTRRPHLHGGEGRPSATIASQMPATSPHPRAPGPWAAARLQGRPPADEVPSLGMGRPLCLGGKTLEPYSGPTDTKFVEIRSILC